MYQDSDYDTDNRKKPGGDAPKAGKPLWKRALKWLGVTAGALAVLFVAICSLIVWILTPARLTPLVEEQAGKYINGRLDIDKVELTFWHTFPRMVLEVDSLVLTSDALAALPDSVA